MINVLVLLGLLLILFRGFIFRGLVSYNETGTRSEVLIINKTLIEKIEEKLNGRIITIDEIAIVSDEITTHALQFTSSQVSRDPNILFDTHRANCIGYSAMYNSIANYIIRSENLESEIVARHKIGHLHLLDFNLNQIIKSPFFHDHDYNVLESLVSGRVLTTDSAVSDYLWIDGVD